MVAWFIVLILAPEGLRVKPMAIAKTQKNLTAPAEVRYDIVMSTDTSAAETASAPSFKTGDRVLVRASFDSIHNGRTGTVCETALLNESGRTDFWPVVWVTMDDTNRNEPFGPEILVLMPHSFKVGDRVRGRFGTVNVGREGVVRRVYSHLPGVQFDGLEWRHTYLVLHSEVEPVSTQTRKFVIDIDVDGLARDLARDLNALADKLRAEALPQFKIGDLVETVMCKDRGEIVDVKLTADTDVCYRLKFARNRTQAWRESDWIPEQMLTMLPYQKGDVVLCHEGVTDIRGTVQTISGLYQYEGISGTDFLRDTYQFESGRQLSSKHFSKINAKEAWFRREHPDWCDEEIALAVEHGSIVRGIRIKYVEPLLERRLGPSWHLRAEDSKAAVKIASCEAAVRAYRLRDARRK